MSHPLAAFAGLTLLLACAPARAQDLVWTGSPAPKAPVVVSSASVGQLADGVALPLVVSRRYDTTSITTLVGVFGVKPLTDMMLAPLATTTQPPPGIEVRDLQFTSYTVAATFSSTGTVSALTEQYAFAFRELVIADEIPASATPTTTVVRPSILSLAGDSVAELDVAARTNILGMTLTLVRDPALPTWRAEPMVLTRRAVRGRSESAFFADLAATGGSLESIEVVGLAQDQTTPVVAWRLKDVRVASYRLLAGGASTAVEQVGLSFAAIEFVSYTGGRPGTSVVVEVAK